MKRTCDNCRDNGICNTRLRDKCGVWEPSGEAFDDLEYQLGEKLSIIKLLEEKLEYQEKLVHELNEENQQIKEALWYYTWSEE